MAWHERPLCRPWLGLYARKVTPGDDANVSDDDMRMAPSFDFFRLPREVLDKIVSNLAAEQLSILAMTSKLWRSIVYSPQHWRRLAERTWYRETRKELERKVVFSYKTWRKLYILRPHMRIHGFYIHRHQYSKTSTRVLTDGPVSPVFLVTYYRLLRFFEDGTVLSLITPEPLDRCYTRVSRKWKPLPHQSQKVSPSIGEFEFDELNQIVCCKLPMVPKQYPNMRKATLFYRFKLDSTRPGAFDTLQLIEYFAVDNLSGEVVSFDSRLGDKPFQFVSRFGFVANVYRYFPKEESHFTKLSKFRSQRKAN